MSPAFLIPWCAGFVLSAIGARIAFRKHLISLSILLSFGVAADIVCAAVRYFYGPDTLGYAFWYQSIGEYSLLCWMGCVICGKLLGERRRIEVIKACMMILVTGALLVKWCFSDATTLTDKLLDSEISLNTLLLCAVAVGWVSRRGQLRGPWAWIAAGFIVHSGSDLICTFLWQRFPVAQHLYSIGELATLILWIAGPLMPHKLKDCRLSLGQRVQESERVSVC